MPWQDILVIVAAAGITGGVSTFATVRALRVHLHYHKETLARHERQLDRHDAEIQELHRVAPLARLQR